ncbi:hypothetical protein [Leifsonia sp. P73]|uniref:hypothetical protein n=1 Tax=Leifsonia sp. P73 TaxID=3423959 RepID=UPI003DA3CBC6
MTDNDVSYEFKTVQSIRGMEGRTRAKWEKAGWEFVEQTEVSMLRSKLSFRRPKKQLSRWVFIAGGAVAVILVAAIVIGSISEKHTAPTSAEVTGTASSQLSKLPTSSPLAAPTSASSTVSNAEVVSTFKDYFAQRAADGVVIAKTVSDVSFSDGVVRVTFDPARANLTRDQFDSANNFPNLASFAATPVAFNDSTGNRIRPVVDSIVTTASDGSSLGTFSHADILALNGLIQ